MIQKQETKILWYQTLQLQIKRKKKHFNLHEFLRKRNAWIFEELSHLRNFFNFSNLSRISFVENFSPSIFYFLKEMKQRTISTTAQKNAYSSCRFSKDQSLIEDFGALGKLEIFRPLKIGAS